MLDSLAIGMLGYEPLGSDSRAGSHSVTGILLGSTSLLGAQLREGWAIGGPRSERDEPNARGASLGAAF